MLDALAVVAPVTCAGCGGPDRGLCALCGSALVGGVERRVTPGGLTVSSALRYEGTVRSVVLAFKEQGRTDVATPLARTLLSSVLDAARAGAHGAGGSTVELVSPPPGKGSRRRRGYDPVPLLLAKAGLPRPASVMRRAWSGSVQKSLDREQRARNARGALLATSALHGRRFVLVDDVLTSGSTLDSLAEAITAAGGSVVAGATLAFTPLHSAERSLGMTGGVSGRGLRAGDGGTSLGERGAEDRLV
ncbi:MAG: hypothetical protein RI885_605 [Actinomycetota bacterium]